jgi:hypothetical protein
MLKLHQKEVEGMKILIKRDLYSEIDALEKKLILYLKTLMEILPEAFAVVKQQDV